MYYKQIDGLRFIAVFMVILHHVFPLFILHKIDLGFFGVNLFFVISGFLITEILLKQVDLHRSRKQILVPFFLRRVLRIFPLYFLYILICYLLVPNQTMEYINWLLSYTMNIWIFLKGELAFWFFTHLWSLAVEEQFYLIWPLVILFVPFKWLRNVIVLFILASIATRFFAFYFVEHHKLFNYVMLPAVLDCFGVGALLAYLKLYRPERLIQFVKSRYIILITITVAVLSFRLGSELLQEVLNRFITAVIAFFLIGKAITNQFNLRMKQFLENRVVVYIGRISYGMYIYHLIVWEFVGKYVDALWISLFATQEQTMVKSFCVFCCVFVCSLVVSIISFELIEKQFLRLKNYTNYTKKTNVL